MTEPLRVGVAGYGVMGHRRGALIDLDPRCERVAVEDRDFRLLFDHDLDALFVCLPNYLAARATIAGLERGLHVFCEKPPGRDLDDIAAVMRTHENHGGSVLMYGFNHRYHGSIQRALSIVQSGQLGAILSLNGVYTKTEMEGWRTDRRQAGGGILLDQGVHMLDLFRLFAGDFERCQSRIRSWGDHPVEDDAWAMLETSSGVVATLHSSATAQQHRFQLDIALERGEIMLSGILSGSMRYAPERIVVNGAVTLDEEFTDDFSFAMETDQFITAALSPQDVSRGASHQAYAAMALVYRIYCADETWKNTYDLCTEPREQPV